MAKREGNSLVRRIFCRTASDSSVGIKRRYSHSAYPLSRADLAGLPVGPALSDRLLLGLVWMLVGVWCGFCWREIAHVVAMLWRWV